MTSDTTPSSLLGGNLKTLRAPLPAGTTLHAWLKPVNSGRTAELTASQDGQEIGRITARNTEEFEFRALVIETAGETSFSYDAASTSLSVV
ncbi:glycoside hydrolase family 32 protein, partial [Sinorhizobium sp. 8-89]|nr:glycoside hydrolase family 32 protein [Sinorhizobium sp. 7-81]